MERAMQRPAKASQGGTEEKVDDGWGRIWGEDSTARPFKTKGSWEFVMLTLSYNKPVDPLRPLIEMAAEKVAEYMPTEEDRKLAPDYVALINNTGIKRWYTKGLDITNSSGQAQKKRGREGEKIKFKAGQLPMEGQGEGEEFKSPQDKQNMNTAIISKGGMEKEGGRRGDKNGAAQHRCIQDN